MERTQGAMDRPPVSDKEIFSRRAICGMLFFGVMLSAVVVVQYCIFLHVYGAAVATTAAFLTISLSELFHGFNVRAEGVHMTKKAFFSGRAMWLTVLVGVVLNVALVLIPALRTAFRLSALTAVQWLWVALCSLAILPVGAAYRFCMARVKPPRLRRRRSGIPVRGSNG